MSLTPFYDEDGIQIFCGDCREILPQIEKVDHVITDPPYEVDAHTKGRRVKRNDGKAPEDRWAYIDRSGTPRYETLPFPPMSDELRAFSAVEFARLAGRWTLVFCQAEAAHQWESSLLRSGLNRRRWCV